MALPARSPADQSLPEPVTVTVARTVAPGREPEFQRWSARLTEAAEASPGFLGAGQLRPSRSGDPWHVIFRFDTAGHLRDWENSPARAAVLATGRDLVASTDIRRVSGLETWFELPGRTAPAPPRWKMFVVSATAIYSLNLIFSVGYGALVRSWPTPLRLAIVSIPVTASMTWLLMPRLTSLLRRWLYPDPVGSAPDGQPQ